MIIGDSITEGVGATELAAYSRLLGEALRTQGYGYCVSACGWSGWINRGDNPPGDVPGYYVVTNSGGGKGGRYDDAASRWHKIDGNRHYLRPATKKQTPRVSPRPASLPDTRAVDPTRWKIHMPGNLRNSPLMLKQLGVNQINRRRCHMLAEVINPGVCTGSFCPVMHHKTDVVRDATSQLRNPVGYVPIKGDHGIRTIVVKPSPDNAKVAGHVVVRHQQDR